MKNILSKLSGANKPIAGLDIGASSIKWMEIGGESLDDIKLLNYAIEEIPKELVHEDGTFTDTNAVAAIIKKCWKKSGSTTRDVAICIPSSSIISKKVLVPIVETESDMQMQIEEEMLKNLPQGMTLEDVGMDYQILGENVQSPTDNDVLLFAAKKEKIDETIALVESAGLNPVILDVDQHSLQNMIRLMKREDFDKKTFLLADCAANFLRIYVFVNGNFMHSKDATIGGVHFTQDLVTNLNISSAQAEKLKKERSEDETYEIVEKTFLNNYVSEFLRAVQYLSSATSYGDIDEVILTGGLASLNGLEDALHNAIVEANEERIKNVPYIGKPLAKIAKNEKIALNKFAKDEPRLFLVTALALRKYLRAY